jgi:hypothetical protein
MTVHSVTVNGKTARFAFEQPSYPGDPKGPGDPDPRARGVADQPGRRPGPQPAAPGLHAGTQQLAGQRRA